MRWKSREERPNYNSTKVSCAYFGFYSPSDPGKRKNIVHSVAAASGDSKPKLLDRVRAFP
jgi:hypothetical protein